MAPTREDAWRTVCEFTSGQGLRRHMLAVEAVMRHYAARFGQDADAWGIAGLLHDFDYERLPGGHPEEGERILAERGWPQELRRAILSHAEHTGVERQTLMERALHASDDVTGLVVAVALVHPSRDLGQIKPSSVRKKWKDRAFAAGVDREAVAAAAEELGVPLDEHLTEVLTAMRSVAPELGLDGSGAP